MAEEQEVMKLREVLKQLLKKHDLTVAQLSRACSVPEKTIHNWLSGHEPKKLDQVWKVAKHFKVSMNYLCGFEEIGFAEKDPLSAYMEDEIYAGKFEVILRRIKNGGK